MGSQVPATNDRSRTYWTPTMERYFIDLMLENMSRGNRTGHTFNKQAWIDMLSVFNAKFRSQYDKDVLKSRYTNLWKQFNDIKNLLGQGGFAWDETRQKVVADDYVWDNYLKAHPDARPYKTKAVLNFSDLCLIYGYTTADGRYSRSSHDIDIDDDVQGVNLGDGFGTLTPSTERSRTDWTIAMDQYFIELMLNQQENGNKLDNTFSKQAWNDMLTSFNAKFGPQHTKRVLRHRYKKLCKYYNDIAVLLKQNGFSWDEKEQMLAANDDVWDAYIKAHPHSRSYRTKSLPNYKHLELIFGSASSTQSLNPDKNLEDVGVKSGSERSRTYWTPPMDRYLIDLLLEQVNSGNRIGQTFVAQAWIDMVTSFNAKFRSHHDKDVLKNRYKHLKRQHHDIKIILEQRGFSWDEAREMVAAEDHIWDAYIEVHPDARSYRVKTVPSYDKLCIIYTQDSSEGIYSRLACNVVPCAERLGSSVGEKEDDRLTAGTGPNNNWTPQMDNCLIELMLAHVESMITADHVFDDQSWASIVTYFTEKCGQNYERCNIQNRYAYLAKQFNDVRRLLAQNGFSWDDTRQMVVADDDVWEAYTKIEPRAISYRGIILGHYKNLSRIFERTILDVDISCQETPGTSFTPIPCVGMDIVEAHNDYQVPARETEASSERRKRTSEMMPSVSEHCSKVQKNEHDDMLEAFTEMANVVSKLVKNTTAETSYNAMERAVYALQAIPDMDDEFLLDACDLLEDEKKAKTFLALDMSLRKKWLYRKLGRC